MGVRGLRTYLKCYCPNACYKVHLPDLISKEWRESKCRPVIVVDAPSCYSMWCRGINWTIGLEVQELIHRLRSFVQAFDDMGARLVFFVAGLTPRKKRKTWLRRRINSIHNMHDVYDLLYANKTYEDIPERLDSIPSNMANFVAFVLKHVLNCTVYVSVEDCDEEIINYVNENDPFAIFAFDTDFVASLMHCIVLDAGSYDFDKKTTLLYDSEVLCKYLRLEEDQLPLLAVLAGNDFIDHEILKPFHLKICNWSKNTQLPYKMLMESIAGYINGLPRWTRLSKKMMEKVCVDVFGNTCRLDDMMVAYRAYIPGPMPEITGDDSWSRVLKSARARLRSVLLPVSAWGVLSEQIYESAVYFEDLRETNDCNDNVRNCPSATITRRLRRRFYGVLLFEKRDSRPTVKEWCAENKDSYRRPVEVRPEYPNVFHPGLRALWNPDRKNPQHRIKWKLFLGAVSPCIVNIADWMSLPDDMVVSTAACYYLYYEKHFLEEWEMNAVLMTLALFSYYGSFFLNALRQTKDSHQSFRALRISIAFSHSYNLLFSLMATCGFPVPLTKDTAYIKFEPVLFYTIYKQVKKRAGLEQICNNNERVLRIFNKMKSTIRG